MKNRRLDQLAVWSFALLVVAPLAYTLWRGVHPTPVFAPVDDSRMAQWIQLGPDASAAPVDLAETVSLTPAELHGALYAYTQFFAIAHDGWAASESTSVWSRIVLSGLPEAADAEAQLKQLPVLRDHMRRTPRWLVALDGPEDRFVGGGVLADPAGRRATLVHRSLVQDGYGGLALCLGGATECELDVALQFEPVDHNQHSGLERYTLSLAGHLRDGNVIIEAISAPVGNAENLRQLVDAGMAIDEYRAQYPSKRLPLADPEQAAAVVQLAARLMIEATQEDSDVVCGPWGHDDLASVAAYVRFGAWMPTNRESGF